jgi:hypothetical protein
MVPACRPWLGNRFARLARRGCCHATAARPAIGRGRAEAGAIEREGASARLD